jgi:2,5-diamino-6-(ribosylamino)-4(3H)-pyrimidinone 5'-phosphate reductase
MKVTICAAMTVDGKISTASGDSMISSKQDLKRLHKLRAGSDAVVVGIATVLADNPRLTVRLVRGKNPARVVVDSKGRTPAESNLLKTARRVRTLVAVSEQAPAQNVERIKKAGAEVVVAGKASVDIKLLFAKLAGMKFKRVLVEGGGELNWSVIRAGLADELTVTIAPRIAGGRLATTLVEGDGFDRMADGIQLRLSKAERKKTGELVLHYKIRTAF